MNVSQQTRKVPLSGGVGRQYLADIVAHYAALRRESIPALRHWLFAVSGALLLAACGTTPSSIVEQPTTARPQAQPAQAGGNGAIYQAAAYRPLFEDRRARHIGDVLTIVINEKTQAGKEASSNGSKTSMVDSSIGAVVGLPLKAMQGLTVNADASSKYDDESALNSSNTFTGSVTATVIEVLPNGNLVVAGEKQIALDKGTEYIRLSGVVQPDTIQAGNVVSSAKVADARIEYRTSAKFDQAEVMSWLARFFLSFIPL
jgi:flagellar L-ring protein precursor FlgH